MLCYRCGSHVPDASETCASCGQKLSTGGVRQMTGTFSRKRPSQTSVENAPYRSNELVAGRYLIKDVLGAGAVGVVFRARDQELDVDVALKSIQPRLVQTDEDRRQFSKALKLARKVSHQNVVRVYDDGVDGDRPFFAMQFLDGLSLRKIIDLRVGKGQLFQLREVEPLIAQIAAALDNIHKLGPHADLKPDNVIVLPDLLKVTDVGLGMAIAQKPFAQAQKGKKHERYLAPEFVEGHEYDTRADLYSLGVIFGEMLSGQTPDGTTLPELLRFNTSLPPQAEGLYRRALNLNPHARFKSAEEFADELRDLVRRTSPPPLEKKAPAAVAPPAAIRPPAPPPALQARREPEPGPLPPPIGTPGPFPPTQQMPRGTRNGAARSSRAAMKAAEVAADSAPPARPPLSAETELVPEFKMPVEPPRAVPVRRPSRSQEPVVVEKQGSTRAVLWLIILTAVGLAAGSAGGWFLLKKLQPAPLASGSQKGQAIVAKSANEEGVARPGTSAADGAVAAGEKGTSEIEGSEPVAAEGTAKAVTAQEAEDPKADVKAEAEADAKSAADAKDSSVRTVAAVVKPPPPSCPSDMRLVRAGSFRMGTAKDDPMMGFDERSLGFVKVAAFCIDPYEYPNKRGALPKTHVALEDAEKLCAAQGKRLCSEEEWERACKGAQSARFPYGNTYDVAACNTQDESGESRSLASSGRLKRCRSPFGVFDLSGNVAEWTSSAYLGRSDRILKGGAFDRPDYASRCSARKNGPPGTRSASIGFRCCSNLQEAP